MQYSLPAGIDLNGLKYTITQGKSDGDDFINVRRSVIKNNEKSWFELFVLNIIDKRGINLDELILIINSLDLKDLNLQISSHFLEINKKGTINNTEK